MRFLICGLTRTEWDLAFFFLSALENEASAFELWRYSPSWDR